MNIVQSMDICKYEFIINFRFFNVSVVLNFSKIVIESTYMDV